MPLPDLRPPHRQPRLLLLVLAGGVCGTLLRYGVSAAVPEHRFPVATFGINVVGSLILGLLLELISREPDEGVRRDLRLGLGSGLLGAFTTYSALATDTDLLVREGAGGLAAAYSLGSVAAGLAAALAGILLVRARRR